MKNSLIFSVVQVAQAINNPNYEFSSLKTELAQVSNSANCSEMDRLGSICNTNGNCNGGCPEENYICRNYLCSPQDETPIGEGETC